jgi:hypothetical protein
MSCKKHREQIILNLYGELAEPEQRELEQHVQDCPSCARDMEYTREVFGLIDRAETDDIPEAGWERCWSQINSGIQSPAPSRKSRWTFGPRWVPVAAAVLLVFALGIFLGRFWPGSQSMPEQAAVQGPDFAPLNLEDHFDSLKPILAEYANRAAGDPETQNVLIDRRIIQSLLVQNFMLMRMAAQNNPEAAELLEDIDLVLREIKNMDPGDPETPAMIRSLIDQRDILFKINVKHTL